MARMRPRVNTDKHYVNVAIATVASTSIANVQIVSGKETPSTNTQVRIGSNVSAIYIELWVESDASNAASSFNITVEKLINAGTPMSNTNAFDLNSYTNKRNILYTTQGLTPAQDNNPIPVIRQWIKIPKGKQRIALEDRINLNIASVAGGVQFCGFFTYKEQF